MFIQGGVASACTVEAGDRTIAAGDRPIALEIAFLQGQGVSAERLRDATAVAAEASVSPDEALIRSGLVSEQIFFRALARHLAVPFTDAPLPVHPRARFPEAVLAGLVPLDGSGGTEPAFAYAPRGEALAALLAGRSRLPAGFVLAAPSRIRDDVISARSAFVAAAAADGLAARHPELSYRGGASRAQFASGYVAGAASAFLVAFAPGPSWAAASALLGLAFLGSTALRLAAVAERVPVTPPRAPPRMSDEALPVYTILIALHREARVVPRLLRAMAALDYPVLCSKLT